VARPVPNALTDAVVARAEALEATLTELVVFRGEVDGPIPLIANSDRVARYLVVYPLGPADGPDGALDDQPVDGTYAWQINCVAGFFADCEILIGKVDAQFNRWTPAVTGVVCGAMRPPAGYQPGAIRPNTEVQPPRYWLPLQYQTVATTT
jgi:hypothetical protein